MDRNLLKQLPLVLAAAVLMPAGLAGQGPTFSSGKSELATKSGIQQQAYNYAADTGAANAYAITISPAPASYTTGMYVAMKAASTNTGAATLNVNGLGAKPIKKQGGATDLVAGDIRAGQMVRLSYDGTSFQMQSTSGNAPVPLTNTLGCLDGYDHLPCTVYDSGLLSSTSITGVPEWTAISSAPTGQYMICGEIVMSATTATQGTLQMWAGNYPGSWYNAGNGGSWTASGSVSVTSATGKAALCAPMSFTANATKPNISLQITASGTPNNTVTYYYRATIARMK